MPNTDTFTRSQNWCAVYGGVESDYVTVTQGANNSGSVIEVGKYCVKLIDEYSGLTYVCINIQKNDGNGYGYKICGKVETVGTNCQVIVLYSDANGGITRNTVFTFAGEGEAKDFTTRIFSRTEGVINNKWENAVITSDFNSYGDISYSYDGSTASFIPKSVIE